MCDSNSLLQLCDLSYSVFIAFDRCKVYTEPLPVQDGTEWHTMFPYNQIKDINSKYGVLKSKNKVWGFLPFSVRGFYKQMKNYITF